ncbi:hypothetical protein Tco_0557818, partial [Tanacetum coccineum]
DSSGDDTNDEDEDDEDDEEEEEHLAPAECTIVVPTDEPVSPPKGTKPMLALYNPSQLNKQNSNKPSISSIGAGYERKKRRERKKLGKLD